MQPPHGSSSSVGVKHRFNTSDGGLEEDRELLLRPEVEDTEEEMDVGEYGASREHFTLLGLGYPSFVCLKLYPGIFNTTLSQILESIICRQDHDTGGSSMDLRCKDETVQGELSMSLSMRATSELIPTVVFSVPYGIAADIYSRKPAVILTTLGCVLYGLLNFVMCMSIHDREY